MSQRELAMALGTAVQMEPWWSWGRLRRKKSLGLCRWWSQIAAGMMRPLPMRAARDKPRKSPKCRSCRSGGSAKARGRKCVLELQVDVWCLLSRGCVQKTVRREPGLFRGKPASFFGEIPHPASVPSVPPVCSSICLKLCLALAEAARRAGSLLRALQKSLLSCSNWETAAQGEFQ